MPVKPLLRQSITVHRCSSVANRMSDSKHSKDVAPEASPAGQGASGSSDNGARPANPGYFPPIAPPPVESATGAGSAFRARSRELAAVCFQSLRHLAVWLWNFISDVARYYWGVRRALGEFIAGFAPNLMSEAKRMREVRLAPYEAHAMAEHDPASGWKLAVPGRCVVCGEKTANPQIDESLLIDDAARAFWVPAASVLVGVPLGLFLFGRWSVLLVIPLGFVLGYLLRGKVPVLLRVARCDAHRTRASIPQVLAWGNTLVIRFGHKSVRRIFLYGETIDTPVAAQDSAAQSMPAVDAHVPAAPETIPLADAPHPDDAMIRHEQPLAFRPEEDDRESTTIP